MFNDRRLLHIYAIIFLDVVVGSIIGPVLPEFVRGHTQPQLWLALGTSLFLGVQLVSAPLLGKLSDAYGRKPIFRLSALGTFLADCLLLPVRMGTYLANRLSDGLTNGLYATVRSAITDISPKEALFRNLGIEGAIISLGFVIGPAIAGLLITTLNLTEPVEQARYVVMMAVGLSGLNVLLSFLLRETHPNDGAANTRGVLWTDLKVALAQSLNVGSLLARLRQKEREHPGLLNLVLMQVALTMAVGYYNYFVAYVSLGTLQMNATDISYFFMYFGGLSVAISYGFYGFIADRINQQRWIFWLAAVGAPVLASYGLVGTSRVWLYVIVTIDCFTYSLIQGLIEGLMAQKTTDTDRGEIFGLNQAMQGLASFGTTLVFGALSIIDLRLPFAWFAACLVVVAWLARK
ncbi:major facilitator superfamily MFS_1 [Fibrella aestuarina BUZ 2]|uniref:Major facilitator superfamily MFS_1 n=1 Tax=Fibrella aestuarina BUZ 2 TaxID=1166018 RepID=I0K460_9BACT|nr:MFS transporter [Fibrella aestuarina]CCG98913.1 major facilitator superfamily MFS_1 [Fibrella aestuarina BUZ 2]